MKGRWLWRVQNWMRQRAILILAGKRTVVLNADLHLVDGKQIHSPAKGWMFAYNHVTLYYESQVTHLADFGIVEAWQSPIYDGKTDYDPDA